MFTWFYRQIDKIHYDRWMVAIGSAVRIVAGGLHYYGFEHLLFAGEPRVGRKAKVQRHDA